METKYFSIYGAVTFAGLSQVLFYFVFFACSSYILYFG